jgi:hypothetical protein
LGNHQAGLNRLSQANLVCENATAFAKTSESKDHRIDLVRVGINACLPLRSRIAFTVVWTADAYKVLGEYTPVEGVDAHVLREFIVVLASL